MLYVHKFISGWLLPPGGIIVMLFLLCGYCFKKRSRLRYPLTAVTVTLYLFSILPVAGMLMQGLEELLRKVRLREAIYPLQEAG